MAGMPTPPARPWARLNLLHQQQADRALCRRRWLLALLLPQCFILVGWLIVQGSRTTQITTAHEVTAPAQSDLWWRQRWQTGHDDALRLLVLLEHATPSGVVLKEASQLKDEFRLTGQASHPGVLSHFEQQLRQQGTFKQRIHREASAGVAQGRPVSEFLLVLARPPVNRPESTP